jgi:hypothetical protein
MIYNLNIKYDLTRAINRIKWLARKGKRIELTEISQRRSIKSNAYLHLLLSAGALEIGETLEHFKRKFYKIEYNKDLFVYERINPKTGLKRLDLRSSSDLTDAEMSLSIERLKDKFCQDTGIVLPEPHEKEFLDYYQNEIEKNKRWL